MADDDADDDLEDEFLAHVAAFEQREPTVCFDALTEAGVALPPPDALGDSPLAAKLWEVINALALLGVFLHNTDHMSDRELYTHLWSEDLREPAVLMPERSDYAYHLDMIGSGSEEDTALYLRFYADERERRSWQREWPGDVVPDHEDPPYDRDRLLPQAESRLDEPVM